MSPECEVVLDISRETLIIGENGAGKTSLIRLIPIFYGENPGHINAGTSPFAQFYLCRTTSYIVFEYERRGQICQTVLYADSADAYRYRLIRAPYDIRLFTVDPTTLVPFDDLKAHLQTHGVPHSKELALAEYRAIIQGRIGGGKEAALQRALVNEYSFAPANTRLEYIDKIVGGMFRRSAEFKDFLRMVVGYLSDKSEPITISGDRAKIGVWPEHFAAYQNVMALGPLMPEIADHENKLLANDHELSCLHAKTVHLIDHFEHTKERLSKEIGSARDAWELQRTAHEQAIAEIQQREATANAAAKAAQDLVTTLDSQARKYETIDIEGKARRFDQRDHLATTIQRLKDQRLALLGEQSKIQAEYDRLKQAAESELATARTRAAEGQEQVYSRFQPGLDTIRVEADAAAEQLRKAFGARSEVLEAQKEAAVNERAKWRHAADNPAADPVALASLERKQKALDEGNQELIKQQQGRAGKEATRQQAIREFQNQERQLTALRLDRDAQQQSLASLISHAEPPSGSLILFLRENYPGWAQDIGKVVREDLLTDCLLAPSMMHGLAPSLYGVSIDLSRTSSSIFADEEQLQQRIAAVRDALSKCQVRLAEAEDQLKTTDVRRQAAEQALAEFDADLAKGGSAIVALQMDVQAARALVKQSRQDNKTAATQKARTAHDAVEQVSSEIRSLKEQLDDDLHVLRQKEKNQRAGLENKRDEELRTIATQLAAAIDYRDTVVNELERQCRQVLLEKGVDVTIVDQLAIRLTQCQADLAETLKWQDPVLAWRHWLESELPSRRRHVEEADGYRRSADKARHLRETRQSLYTQKGDEFARRSRELENGIESAREKAKDGRIVLAQLEDYPADAATLARPYDLSWTPDGVIAMRNKLLAERKVSSSDLKVRVNEIKRAFRDKPTAPTGQYFEAIESTIDPDDENHRAWVAPLHDWFSSRHKEYLTTLLVEAKALGRLIEQFHSDATKFDRDIKTFNNGIKRSLDRTRVFRRITDVSVTFVSTMSSKAYWQPIAAFVDSFHSWVSSPGNDLPPAGFAESISELMGHWELKTGIREDRLGLIDMRGSVTENGKAKSFANGHELGTLSSNGLSYLILTLIFVAFINMIRRDAKVQVTWAVDELSDLDAGNISLLLEMLRGNGISLVSACPEAEVDVLMNFATRYKVVRNDTGPEVVRVVLSEEEVSHV